MWKNILATAALVLSIGVTYRLMQPANAGFGPQVSHGQNPIVNYGGYASNGVTIFTAPSDQDVILKTIITSTDCQVAIDGTVIVPTTSYFYPTYLYTRAAYAQPQTVFTTGDASLKIPAGSAMSFSGCSATYYMEGYLMHP